MHVSYERKVRIKVITNGKEKPRRPLLTGIETKILQ